MKITANDMAIHNIITDVDYTFTVTKIVDSYLYRLTLESSPSDPPLWNVLVSKDTLKDMLKLLEEALQQ